MSEQSEPREDELPVKPPMEPLPDDVDQEAGEEDVDETTYMPPDEAAGDETVDDTEAEPQV